MFKNRRKLLSQNFLKDRNLVFNLLRQTSIGKNDTVLDIGAGKGIITEEISKVAGKVFAIEIDERLADSLSKKFKYKKNVVVLNKDFRDFYLPKVDYKVFSNIPFIITSAVIKKLVFANNPPKDAYLIIQNEASQKFISDRFNKRNSQVSILINPFFELKVIHKFKRSDFYPIPKVDSVILHIKKWKTPLVTPKNRGLYQDLVVYIFNQTKPNIEEGLGSLIAKKEIREMSGALGITTKSKPSELSAEDWIKLFQHIQKYPSRLSKVKHSFLTQSRLQKKLKKIHRTRKDREWRKYQ